ncbi:MAG: aminotransferase class III-fold pyridoxal phosphate-dependent enzyme [Kiloniellaceae bacterium]|nr:aminotransferase class III-fold pyridoxal phosphate-dependent enzyme [Kiloniellaceae bacterium]
MSNSSQLIDAADIEIAADDPLHGEAALPFSRYGIVDHVSHFSGIAVSVLYLVAAGATLWEVVARYVFNAPTQWAFEVVMVLCAATWMISSGYVTLKQRHIGITVFHVLASDRVRWWLDLFATLVGIAALFLLLSDAAIRAYTAISHVERTGRLLRRRLEELASRFPHVIAEVRGVGLMIGLKCVVTNTDLVARLREEGLLTVGAAENVLRLLPPLIIEERHVEEAVQAIERACSAIAKAA